MKLLFKKGQDFLNIQYSTCINCIDKMLLKCLFENMPECKPICNIPCQKNVLCKMELKLKFWKKYFIFCLLWFEHIWNNSQSKAMKPSLCIYPASVVWTAFPHEYLMLYLHRLSITLWKTLSKWLNLIWHIWESLAPREDGSFPLSSSSCLRNWCFSWFSGSKQSFGSGGGRGVPGFLST